MNLINTDLYFTIKRGASLNYQYKFSKNRVKLQENLLSDLFETEEHFYQDIRNVGFYESDYNLDSDRPLLSVQFLLDDQVMNFIRTKQTIPEVFSILGGLLGFLLGLIDVVMGVINKNLFEIELINKLFSEKIDY